MPDPFGPLTSAARNAANALGLTDPINQNIPGSSVTIEELGGRKRVIVLKGRAMPYQGVGFPGEQRTKLTWYPGNPVATQQVLGPTEGTTSFIGTWKDRFVRGAIDVDNGNNQGVGAFTPPSIVSSLPLPDGFGGGGFDTAEKIVQLFHSIRRAGTPLKVTWTSEVRFGILKYFEPIYDRITDAEWEMEFEWNAFSDAVQLRSAVIRDPASDLQNLFNTVLDTIALADDVTRSFVAALVTTVNNIEGLVSDVFGILQVIDTIVDAPASVFGALRSSFQRLERELTELIRRVGDVRWNSTTGGQANTSVLLLDDTQSPLIVNSQRARSSSSNRKLQFERNRRSIGKAAQNLRQVAERAVNDRLQARNPKTTRVVTVREGSTLYDLSIQFYGTPDFANFIAASNSLALGSVPPGTKLRLPPRPTAALGNIEVTGGRNKQQCPPTGYDENCRLLGDC